MKAIQIRYYGPTSTKGSRFRAWTEAGSMTVGYDYDFEFEGNALELAKAYCAKHNWSAPAGIGSLPNGDFVVTLEAIA
tara:strand:- start:170 stop:403 length:234 start_codon:yes stop_codon:yes gene_type:complete